MAFKMRTGYPAQAPQAQSALPYAVLVCLSVITLVLVSAGLNRPEREIAGVGGAANYDLKARGAAPFFLRIVGLGWFFVSALGTPFVAILVTPKEWFYVYVLVNVGLLSIAVAITLYKGAFLSKASPRTRHILGSTFFVVGISLLLFGAFGAAATIDQINDSDFEDADVGIASFILPTLEEHIGLFEPGKQGVARFPVHGPLGEDQPALVHDVEVLTFGIVDDNVLRPLLEKRLKQELTVADQAEKAAEESGNQVEEQEAFTYSVILHVALDQLGKPLSELITLSEGPEGRDSGSQDTAGSKSAWSSVFTGFSSVLGLFTALLTAVAGCVVAFRSTRKPAALGAGPKVNAKAE